MRFGWVETDQKVLIISIRVMKVIEYSAIYHFDSFEVQQHVILFFKKLLEFVLIFSQKIHKIL